jgi:hypothetical protein
LKAAREKGQVTYKGRPITITPDFSPETESQKILDRCYTVTKKTQMPAQATIPSQTFNYYRWRNQSIPRPNHIHTLSFHESCPLKDNNRKKNTRTETTPYKKQESNPSTNQKEDIHKNRMQTLTTKIIGSNNYFSLISLNINGFSSPIKRHRLTDWLQKQDPIVYCLQETHLREKGRHYLRLKGWKIIFQANGLKKSAGVTI